MPLLLNWFIDEMPWLSAGSVTCDDERRLDNRDVNQILAANEWLENE